MTQCWQYTFQANTRSHSTVVTNSGSPVLGKCSSGRKGHHASVAFLGVYCPQTCGHSADERPSHEMKSVSCHHCHGELGRLQGSTIRCKTCRMIRWCSYWCWDNARKRHNEVCFAAGKRYVGMSLQDYLPSSSMQDSADFQKSVPEVADLQPSRVSRDKPRKLAYSKADMYAVDDVYLGGPIDGQFPKM